MKSSDYLAFFSFSFNHKPIATNITPTNHKTYNNIDGTGNIKKSPPPNKLTKNITIPKIINNIFVAFISSSQPYIKNQIVYFNILGRFLTRKKQVII